MTPRKWMCVSNTLKNNGLLESKILWRRRPFKERKKVRIFQRKRAVFPENTRQTLNKKYHWKKVLQKSSITTWKVETEALIKVTWTKYLFLKIKKGFHLKILHKIKQNKEAWRVFSTIKKLWSKIKLTKN